MMWASQLVIRNWLIRQGVSVKPTSKWDRGIGLYGTDVSFAVESLTLSANQYGNFDASSMGVGNNCEANDNKEDIKYNNNKHIASTGISIIDRSGIDVVCKLSRNIFTQKLI